MHAHPAQPSESDRLPPQSRPLIVLPPPISPAGGFFVSPLAPFVFDAGTHAAVEQHSQAVLSGGETVGWSIFSLEQSFTPYPSL